MKLAFCAVVSMLCGCIAPAAASAPEPSTPAPEVLFVKARVTFDEPGSFGKVVGRELTRRLYKHPLSWTKRFYYSGNGFVEVLEFYTKDGKSWVRAARATPSPAEILYRWHFGSTRFDIDSALRSVVLEECSSEIGPELEQVVTKLWGTMLPGVNKEPPSTKAWNHPPIGIAFRREQGGQIAGKLAYAAIGEPVYQAFTSIIAGMSEMCRMKGDERSERERDIIEICKVLEPRLRR